MAHAFSTYLRPALLDEIFNNTNFVPPSENWLSLHTGDPAGTGANEMTLANYARVRVWDQPSASTPEWNLAVVDGTGHLVDNNQAVSFTTATASWGTATHFGCWDDSTAGNFLGGGALTTSKAIGASDQAKFNSGDCNFKVD